MKWIAVDLLLPENDTNVIGCCDDVFECRHFDDGAFEDCKGKMIEVSFWMPMPDSYYQDGQIGA